MRLISVTRLGRIAGAQWLFARTAFGHSVDRFVREEINGGLSWDAQGAGRIQR